MRLQLNEALAGKWEDGTRPKDLYAREIAKRPADYAPDLVEGLRAKQKRVKAGCAELASLLSQDYPELLYPHVDHFLANLDAKEPVLRWEAACTVGNLAAVDARKRIPEHVGTLVALLEHESIVLQGHAAKALGKIARAEPKVAPRILSALFASADAFPGTRVGYLLEASEFFASVPATAKRMKELVEPFAASELRPVAAKAKRVLKKLAG